ncbi:hypothetical protein LOD99_7598 [Oopsacas minuta]|uniref:Uncharacterized protein n=1 Tax=Oopsacas minuta TaxID=111878 RepID=A0AAV7JNK6_9METZ|nr:hypothetical protein LOD99_7598 [Oopsacas minuta]
MGGLSAAKALIPLNATFVRILDEKVRDDCRKELSNDKTFLSDVTINAFGVLIKNNYPDIEGFQDTICLFYRPENNWHFKLHVFYLIRIANLLEQH